MKPNEDQLPDLLQQLKGKGDGFKKADAAYFTQMTKKAMAQAQQPKQLSLKAKPLPYRRWLAYAASLALVLSLAWQWQINRSDFDAATVSTDISAITLDDLDDAEIMEYINDNLSDFELEQLADGAEL